DPARQPGAVQMRRRWSERGGSGVGRAPAGRIAQQREPVVDLGARKQLVGGFALVFPPFLVAGVPVEAEEGEEALMGALLDDEVGAQDTAEVLDGAAGAVPGGQDGKDGRDGSVEAIRVAGGGVQESFGCLGELGAAGGPVPKRAAALDIEAGV